MPALMVGIDGFGRRRYRWVGRQMDRLFGLVLNHNVYDGVRIEPRERGSPAVSVSSG
jgi:hypothetical protein